MRGKPPRPSTRASARMSQRCSKPASTAPTSPQSALATISRSAPRWIRTACCRSFPGISSAPSAHRRRRPHENDGRNRNEDSGRSPESPQGAIAEGGKGTACKRAPLADRGDRSPRGGGFDHAEHRRVHPARRSPPRKAIPARYLPPHLQLRRQEIGERDPEPVRTLRRPRLEFLRS